MPDKKKKIYIAIIVICLISTAAVLYYGFFRTPTASPSFPVTGAQPGSGQQATNSATLPDQLGSQGNSSLPGSAPAVFPEDTTFDWSLVNSDQFKKLVPTPDLQLGPVGRSNPFSKP